MRVGTSKSRDVFDEMTDEILLKLPDRVPLAIFAKMVEVLVNTLSECAPADRDERAQIRAQLLMLDLDPHVMAVVAEATAGFVAAEPALQQGATE